jgi:hypothetical protein
MKLQAEKTPASDPDVPANRAANEDATSSPHDAYPS